MAHWNGHSPVTTIALHAIFVRASRRDCELSADERLLFTTAEFWAAMAASELHAHLGQQPVLRLEQAGVALNLLGAAQAAVDIFRSADVLRGVHSGEQRRECLARLERQLQSSMETVDALIGSIAQRCLLGQRHHRLLGTGPVRGQDRAPRSSENPHKLIRH